MECINDKRLKLKFELNIRRPEILLPGAVITIKKCNLISDKEKEYNYPLDYQNGDIVDSSIIEEHNTMLVMINMKYYDSLYQLLYEFLDSVRSGNLPYDFDICINGIRAYLVNMEVECNSCNNHISVSNMDNSSLICASKNIVKVLFNEPYTIVFWEDKTKTKVKCQEGDTYDKEKGLAMCIVKKLLGNKYEYYDVFNKWLN